MSQSMAVTPHWWSWDCYRTLSQHSYAGTADSSNRMGLTRPECTFLVNTKSQKYFLMESISWNWLLMGGLLKWVLEAFFSAYLYQDLQLKSQSRQRGIQSVHIPPQPVKIFTFIEMQWPYQFSKNNNFVMDECDAHLQDIPRSTSRNEVLWGTGEQIPLWWASPFPRGWPESSWIQFCPICYHF